MKNNPFIGVILLISIEIALYNLIDYTHSSRDFFYPKNDLYKMGK